MARTHNYGVSVSWTGNRGTGTSHYQAYGRDHVVSAAGLPPILASSDPAFRGEQDRWNPELGFVATLSQCHMLWYLHLCAVAGVRVTQYTDSAIGSMSEADDGSGHFDSVTLRPQVTVASQDMIQAAISLHHDANAKCFIANSVNFPVHHEPVITVED